MTGPVRPLEPMPPTGPCVFPAAAVPAGHVDEHPIACPCGQCTDALLARLARPLVPPGPLTDPALTGTTRGGRR